MRIFWAFWRSSYYLSPLVHSVAFHADMDRRTIDLVDMVKEAVEQAGNNNGTGGIHPAQYQPRYLARGDIS